MKQIFYWKYLIVFFFFVFFNFQFYFPKCLSLRHVFLEWSNWICRHWDNYLSIFFVNKQPILLSQWPFSLFVAKTCLSDRICAEYSFACGGLINLWITFRNSFFTQKAVWKTLLSSFFETVFWVKKEFPNVTRKLISPPKRKKFRQK